MATLSSVLAPLGIQKIRANKFAGRCECCGDKVAAGSGFAIQLPYCGSRWALIAAGHGRKFVAGGAGKYGKPDFSFVATSKEAAESWGEAGGNPIDNA